MTDLLLASFFERSQCEPMVPEHADAHRWRYALPRQGLGESFLWDAEQSLGLCGDWCGASGRVEAAYLSGLSLAHHLTSAEEFRRG